MHVRIKVFTVTWSELDTTPHAQLKKSDVGVKLGVVTYGHEIVEKIFDRD